MDATLAGHVVPDLDPAETLRSIRERIAALELDLSGLTVVTEAATGAYAVTAVIAALAGARAVHAVARDTRRYGSFEDAARATLRLAEAAGVASRIEVHRAVAPAVLASCDILTNSGHLRPISAQIVRCLPPGAVVALMFEAWEFRDADLDLQVCRELGVQVAAVNERHGEVGVFAFLGALCLRLLADARIAVAGARVALICDNPFESFLRDGLEGAGARVVASASVETLPPDRWDVVVLAVNPSASPEIGPLELRELARRARGAHLVQFWGDIDRRAVAAYWPGTVFPLEAPGKGHMALLLSELGHEPVVRLQTGGLRAAELAFRGCDPAISGLGELL